MAWVLPLSSGSRSEVAELGRGSSLHFSPALNPSRSGCKCLTPMVPNVKGVGNDDGRVLQIAKKRREAKGKGEKERYTHLNAEFRRTAKRDKKAFLNDHCKEIAENNRMGKTRDLFKKKESYQGNISCKNGHNKGMDLTEAEDIKKRWQEYTEE